MRQAPRFLIPLLLALFLIAVALPGSAATINPPQDIGQIARASRAVVLAEAVDSRTELRGGIPFTLTQFRVVRSVAGEEAGRSLVVETRGGVVEEKGFVVPGTPTFAKGGRYLLFLDPAPGGNWRLKMSSYGILREAAGTGLLRPVPEAAQLEVLPRPGVEAIGVYREADLLGQLAAVKAGAPWHRQAAEATAADLARLAEAKAGDQINANPPGVSVANAPAACRFIAADPNGAVPDNSPVRWFGFETGGAIGVWSTTPGQPGISDGGAGAVQNGAAAWTNHNASAIKLLYAGSKASSFNCATADGGFVSGEVTFNDPCSQLPPLAVCSGAIPPGWTSTTCCGTVAEYGYSFNASGAPLTYDGQPWRQLTGLSVVVNDGSQCLGETDFQEMMTHFLGHSLGFEHHNDPDATMYVSLGAHTPRGATISTTDKACASFAYHTFLDVPYNYFAWRFIEAANNAGVMTTCGSGNFCPNDVVTRGSMALLLLRAKEGAGYVPPPCTTATFADVPCSDPLAPWVEELVRRGVTAGCGGGNYCPTNPVTRNQMAVFLIKTTEGPSFVPPACTTDPFNDVPCSSPFAPWVKLITDRGITAGCGGGAYCPNNTVVRAQMAVFSSVNFHLPLP
ncbi:MAG: S-layer homology domain-containing protein [Thermoanaerobaculia bacterium]